ncbi:MAG: LptF/LptG family permease [Planctomycetes bacterium]|nr:LptF/LptG family permease [Planctomycetota bacterium]
MGIKQLDRYLASNIIKLFFAGFFAFCCLFIFIDLFDKAFKFNEQDGADKVMVLVRFYAASLPGLFELTGPFIFCLSSFFVLARFQAGSQLIAINASGIPLFRMMETILLIGVFVGALVFFCSEYLSPVALPEKIKLEDPHVFNGKIDSIHFRDKLEIENEKLSVLLQFSRDLDFIDVENVRLNEKKSGAFHATLFDQYKVPKIKIFARSCQWDENGLMTLKKAVVFPYSQNAFHNLKKYSYPELKVKTDISIKSIALAKVDVKSLNMSQLHFLMHNREIFAEYFFRIFQALYPVLMIMVSFALALPILFKKPIYSYFACLACCFSVFTCANILRNEISVNELSPIIAAAALIIGTMAVYLYGRKNIPT